MATKPHKHSPDSRGLQTIEVRIPATATFSIERQGPVGTSWPLSPWAPPFLRISRGYASSLTEHIRTTDHSTPWREQWVKDRHAMSWTVRDCAHWRRGGPRGGVGTHSRMRGEQSPMLEYCLPSSWRKGTEMKDRQGRTKNVDPDSIGLTSPHTPSYQLPIKLPPPAS